MHQADIGNDATLQQVGLAVEAGVRLALGDDRADPGRGVESRDPRSPARSRSAKVP